MSHPWVNQYMQVVGHPDLNGWDGTAPPMIGDVVSAVIREFRREVPAGKESRRDENPSAWGEHRVQPPGLSSVPIAAQAVQRHFSRGDGLLPMGASIGNASGVSTANASTVMDPSNSVPRRGGGVGANASRRQGSHHTPIPAIPTKFDELQGMTTAQLSRLLEDGIARQALLLGMPSVVGMKELRTEVRQGNVETAKCTLSKQDKARTLREETEGMRVVLKDLQTSYEGVTY